MLVLYTYTHIITFISKCHEYCIYIYIIILDYVYMSDVKKTSNKNHVLFLLALSQFPTTVATHFGPSPTGNVSSEIERRRVTLGRGVRELEVPGPTACSAVVSSFSYREAGMSVLTNGNNYEYWFSIRNISVILCIDIDVKLDVCKYIVHQWLVYIHVVSVKGDLHL